MVPLGPRLPRAKELRVTAAGRRERAQAPHERESRPKPSGAGTRDHVRKVVPLVIAVERSGSRRRRRAHSEKSSFLRTVSLGLMVTVICRLMWNSGLVTTSVCFPAASVRLTGVCPRSTPSTATEHHGFDAIASVPSPLSGVAAAAVAAGAAAAPPPPPAPRPAAPPPPLP